MGNDVVLCGRVEGEAFYRHTKVERSLTKDDDYDDDDDVDGVWGQGVRRVEYRLPPLPPFHHSTTSITTTNTSTSTTISSPFYAKFSSPNGEPVIIKGTFKKNQLNLSDGVQTLTSWLLLLLLLLLLKFTQASKQGHNTSKKKTTFSRLLRGLKTHKKEKQGQTQGSPRHGRTRMGVPQRGAYDRDKSPTTIENAFVRKLVLVHRETTTADNMSMGGREKEKTGKKNGGGSGDGDGYGVVVTAGSGFNKRTGWPGRIPWEFAPSTEWEEFRTDTHEFTSLWL
ncbi:hypothetical protein M0804_009717 [Polistes exclamans]|nr:hypothetical protein M0804_009717 [Polistes exclamans]